MVELFIDSRRRRLGGGMCVSRLLPYVKRRMVGPFVFFDHMGPVDIAAGTGRAYDVRPHPHIGLSAVTYLFSGEIVHRDSVGTTCPLQPHAVNWMTAGRGITHSERFERARTQGDRVHGIQAWVALAAEQEETEPSFSHHVAARLPRWHQEGVSGWLIAGDLHGLRAGAKTTSPLFYAHLQMAAASKAEIPATYGERAIYVAAGSVTIGAQTVAAGRMAVIGPLVDQVHAAEAATVMLLGGEPVGERFIYWNFVSSRRERLAQAASDWQAGRMQLPDADSTEFEPLPEGPAPAPPTMS
jgi:hypothetical protein